MSDSTTAEAKPVRADDGLMHCRTGHRTTSCNAPEHVNGQSIGPESLFLRYVNERAERAQADQALEEKKRPRPPCKACLQVIAPFPYPKEFTPSPDVSAPRSSWTLEIAYALAHQDYEQALRAMAGPAPCVARKDQAGHERRQHLTFLFPSQALAERVAGQAKAQGLQLARCEVVAPA